MGSTLPLWLQLWLRFPQTSLSMAKFLRVEYPDLDDYRTLFALKMQDLLDAQKSRHTDVL